MTSIRQFAFQCFAIAAAMFSSPATGNDWTDDSVYSVGVSKVDITPNYPIRLNGFGARRDESEGITHRIWAKAIAIGTEAEQPAILITVDSTGLPMSMVDEVAARLHAKAGIARERLIVTFTHTHTAPKITGVCDTVFSTPIPADHQARIDRYTKELTDALETVALEALKHRQPARLSWRTGEVGFAKNRRTPSGPVDHSLPMLVVKSADDDVNRAIYLSYACHCVTLSDNKISGDWAGFAQSAIERNHLDAVALVSIGCGSDADPDSGVTGGNVAVAAEQGGQIAAEVERVLSEPLKPISGSVATTFSRIDLPLNPVPSRSELEQLATLENSSGYNAKFQLSKLDRGESLLSAVNYPIQTLSFGDSLCMVFLGSEVCVDYAIRLRQELDAPRVWIHGYSNDLSCYVPSERLLREGGYGGGAEIVYFALPNTLQTGLEDKIIAEVRRQTPKTFHAPPEHVASLSGLREGRKPPTTDEPNRDQPPSKARTAIAKLVATFEAGTPKEYEQIPAIWEAAIAAGRRNDTDEIRDVLDYCVPRSGEPLRDWQAVVVGGGIINGLSAEGHWPRRRINKLLQANAPLQDRWEKMFALAAMMADNDAIRTGTRYDALRILGCGTFDDYGHQLVKYLGKDVHHELQMGAVSGLSDIEDRAATQAIASAFDDLHPTNREIAINALLRSEDRMKLLIDALESGTISLNALSSKQIELLKGVDNTSLRQRASRLFRSTARSIPRQ
jgi:hypothetical protein